MIQNDTEWYWNDTVYLNLIEEFDKVSLICGQDGDTQIEFQYSIEIMDFCSIGGSFCS